MSRICGLLVVLVSLQASPIDAASQSQSAGTEYADGSAVILASGAEYKIRIECDASGHPEAGFSTEPNRITREATGGKSNMVNLRLRAWKETGDVIVTLDRYVAWIPKPAPQGGILSLTVDMSPASVERDGTPVAFTYDMWQSGDRPPGLEGVWFEANCTARDPEAPSFRKVQEGN